MKVGYASKGMTDMETIPTRKGEPASERITTRLPLATRTIIERAAAIYGASINQFIVRAAVERANEILTSTERLKLSARDAELFLGALANPAEPNTKLLGAIEAHDLLVGCS